MLRFVLVIALVLPSLPLAAQQPARLVAVTIDDLPLAEGRGAELSLANTRRVNVAMLEALTAHGVQAVGFVNERRLQREDERDARVAILEAWLDAGQELGNHSYSHPDLDAVEAWQFEDAVVRGDVALRELLAKRGRRPQWFRFPYNHTGATPELKQRVGDFLGQRGYTVAPFSVEHADYLFAAVYDSALAAGDEELARRVREAYLAQLDTAFDYAEALALDSFGTPIPQIFLIHVNRLNADCLDAVLDRLETRGYRYTTLAAALEHAAWQTPDDYVGKWGISWLHRFRVALGLPERMDEPDPPRWLIQLWREQRSD